MQGKLKWTDETTKVMQRKKEKKKLLKIVKCPSVGLAFCISIRLLIMVTTNDKNNVVLSLAVIKDKRNRWMWWVNRPISEVTSRHVISRSGGQA